MSLNGSFACKRLNRRLGGVVVSVFATGPKGHGFKPSRGDGFLRAIKLCSTPPFGWEVPCHKILQHVKDPLMYQRYWTWKILIPSSIPPTYSRRLCWLDCQWALVDKSGFIPSRHHHHHSSPLTFMTMVLWRQFPPITINQSINQEIKSKFNRNVMRVLRMEAWSNKQKAITMWGWWLCMSILYSDCC
jgi:hypothetical protein